MHTLVSCYCPVYASLYYSCDAHVPWRNRRFHGAVCPADGAGKALNGRQIFIGREAVGGLASTMPGVGGGPRAECCVGGCEGGMFVGGGEKGGWGGVFFRGGAACYPAEVKEELFFWRQTTTDGGGWTQRRRRK